MERIFERILNKQKQNEKASYYTAVSRNYNLFIETINLLDVVNHLKTFLLVLKLKKPLMMCIVVHLQ